MATGREYVTVTWTRFRYDELCIPGGAQDGYVYLVTHRQRLKYIGLAYHQTAAKRISTKAHIRAKYEAILPEIYVWVGQVNVARNSFSYLIKSRIEAIEALLIHLNQPDDNRMFKKNYGRRPNLTVYSRGTPMPPLLPTVWAVNGVCFPASARPGPDN
jgi:hypothetical protein